MISERTVLLALLIASSLMFVGVMWYANVAQRRLPNERWWRWIAVGFFLGIVRAWIGFAVSRGFVERAPWEIVSGVILLVIGVILLFSIRAAARQAELSSRAIELLDRTDLLKLEAQIDA